MGGNNSWSMTFENDALHQSTAFTQYSCIEDLAGTTIEQYLSCVQLS